MYVNIYISIQKYGRKYVLFLFHINSYSSHASNPHRINNFKQISDLHPSNPSCITTSTITVTNNLTLLQIGMQQKKKNYFQVCRLACAAAVSRELQSFSVTLIDYLLPIFDSTPPRRAVIIATRLHETAYLVNSWQHRTATTAATRVKVTFHSLPLFSSSLTTSTTTTCARGSCQPGKPPMQRAQDSRSISLIDHEIRIKINRSIVNKSIVDWIYTSAGGSRVWW